ncbi:MAG TPA: hypothetical protein PLB30_00955 [Thermoleophilia bacterium]|nr:hypothetical protein [Thermoleophilia bacterium]HQG02720.1 hypothetical protein [Thermoleophilia bacterium]HQG54251.1 hypothetical protein [Thermoleophilia bacterium]HQJ97107.1 hypothetical protein [Thermoleophilia bacterium]
MTCGQGTAFGERTADAPTVASLYRIIADSDVRALAVIGLVKNAGKTTVVNSLMSACARVFGLTSLGLDGERVDHLTGLAKPSVAPPPGTLVATTRGSLERSRYAMEVLEELPFHTPLGNVVIGRAGEDGHVEVSGPTTLAELRVTVQRLQAHGAEQVLVDGAINRLGSASPRVSDGVVVATGGMVGDTLDEVIQTTVATLDLLTLPEVSPATRGLVDDDMLASARAVAVDGCGGPAPLRLDTVIGEGVTVAREVERLDAHTLFIGGALTRDFAEDFTRVLPPRRKLRVVVRDATVLVLPPTTVSLFTRRGIALEVLQPLRVLALTVNPFRVPQPYHPKVFFKALVDAVGSRLPVFDVVNGLASLPESRARATAPIPPDA